MTTPHKPVRAAGCVLWRRSPSGDGIELALISRPKWGDWSHPKGKLKRGETHGQAAVRETLEETGMTCELGPELPTLRYLVDDRPKEVRYWAAEAIGGAFASSAEVDRMRWCPPAVARDQLTQERDKELVDALLSALHATGEVR
ncbi:NUDIX hydrolase [Streptomyces lydicus]|uniref:NUDIX hydrolase n=1 Tax=Streptomyces lydicus TaxID=47763 RepID=UPI0033F78623